ncbi:S8 family serine peptidase [Pelagicoccus mobilis]|uniref:S8 family serine peptidase n=1 Tax=Pelagicoccus mobilis TaxID=415221 RepID=A0A934S1U1_9BACT|nr:S8 family serine peptidase [Pelagicoccus mobilis]MBK1878307.1 S8 family serine peptidase [Pelagicoccus mobilis]
MNRLKTRWMIAGCILLGAICVVIGLRQQGGVSENVEVVASRVEAPNLRFVEEGSVEALGRGFSERSGEREKAVESRLEARGRVLDQRFVAGTRMGEGRWELLLEVEDLAFPVRVVRRVLIDPSTATERTLAIEEMAADRMIVRLSDDADFQTVQEELAKRGARLGRALMGGRLYELQLASADLEAFAVALDGGLGMVAGRDYLYLEPDYVVHVSASPDDASYLDESLWGLNNLGQQGGVEDVDIDAPEAWDVRTSTGEVVVAVIDSGINYEHQDLRGNLWVNETEVPGNGLDDDGNGYVDDVYGINAVDGSGDPLDDNGHGSHCAGTIGAEGDNGLGVVGVAWSTRLMGLKFISSEGSGALSDAIECIDYAVTMGATVLNNSWGGGSYSQAMFDAIAVAEESGVVFVVASGNSGVDTDEEVDYPGGYELGNVIAVSAVDRDGELAVFSNYGLRSVDVAAPGVSILSTWFGEEDAYKSIDGTSMAAPHVSGVAALLQAEFPEATLRETVNRLKYGSKPFDSLLSKVSVGGMVSARKALDLVDAPFPPEFVVRPESEYVVNRGNALSVAVEVESEAEVMFRWFRNGSLLDGAADSFLSIENANTEDVGDYRVEVENGDGVAMALFSVSVVDPDPSLAEAFDAVGRDFFSLGDEGWSAYFSDSVTGGSSIRSGAIGDSERSVLRTRVQGPGVVSFYWRLSSEPLWDRGVLRIDGVQEKLLSTEDNWERVSIELGESRDYEFEWVYEKDGSRSMGQDALFLDGFLFESLADSAPVIVRNPESAIVGPGEHHALGVEALGESLEYQWFFEGEAIEGEESDLLVLFGVQAEDDGVYRVVVSNAHGEVESARARVRIEEVPVSILTSPVDQTRRSGESVLFSAVVEGALPIGYQWYKNGLPLVGAVGSRLFIDNLDTSDAGEYFLRVGNAHTDEPVESEVAVLSIEDFVLKPEIVKQPIGGYWQSGDAFRLSVVAEGGQPYSFQWYSDGEAIAGATEQVFEKAAEAGDSGGYRVLVSNAQGQTWSEWADVVVVGDLAEALEFPGSEWDLSGAHYLFSQGDVSFDGEDALQTSPVNSLLPQFHGMKTEVVGPANFSVYWKQAGATGFSGVSLYLDDELQVELRDESDWRRVFVKIPEGSHSLEFRIRNELGCRIWLDQVELSQTPVLYSQPESRVLLEGESLSLAVDAFGEEPVSFQWFKDEILVGGAESNVYSPNGNGLELVGRYWVEVENAHGKAVSEVAEVDYLEDASGIFGEGTVLFDLDKDSDWEVWKREGDAFQLRSRPAIGGESRRLEGTASGPGVLVLSVAMRSSVCCPSLEIAVDGAAVDGVVTRSGEFDELEYARFHIALDEGEHLLSLDFLAAEDFLGRSQFGVLSGAYVTSDPVFVRHPSNVRALEGEAVELSVELFEEGGVSFQWYREDGTPVSGAGESVFRIESLVEVDDGFYYCEATVPSGGTARSELARVEVIQGFYEAVGVDFGRFSSGMDLWIPQAGAGWDGGEALAFEADRASGLSSLWLDLDGAAGSASALRFRIKIEGQAERSYVEVTQPKGKVFKFFENTDWQEVVVPIDAEAPLKSLVFSVLMGDTELGGSMEVLLDDFELVRYPVVYDDLADVVALYGLDVLLEPRVSGTGLSYQWYRDEVALAGANQPSLQLKSSFSNRGKYRLRAWNSHGEVFTRENELGLMEEGYGAEVVRRGAFSLEGETLWSREEEGLANSGPLLAVEGVSRGESSDLYFQVKGPGVFKFDWRLAASRNEEKLYCYIYDTLVGGVYSGDRWRSFSLELPEEAVYPFRVSLTSFGGDAFPGGQAWVDNFRFSEDATNGYGSWVEDAFAGSEVPEEGRRREADADGDGVANGVEYLLRLDPTSIDDYPSPKIIEDDGSLQALLDFDLNLAARDARVGLEISEDLEVWYPMESVLLLGEGGDESSVLLSPIDDEDRGSSLFVRVAVYFDLVD